MAQSHTAGGCSIALSVFPEELEKLGATVVSVDVLDTGGIRLVYTSSEHVADSIVGAYLGLHTGEAQWRASCPPGGALLWEPDGLSAVKIFESGGERYAQTYAVRSAWVQQYLSGRWSMEDVLGRVGESVGDPRPVDPEREWGFD